MKILFLAHRIPYPPDKGDKVRSFHWVRYLSGRHEVHLGCLVDDRADLAHLPALERMCASVEAVYRAPAARTALAGAALLLGGSLSVRSFHSARLRRAIAGRIAEVRPHLIVAYSSVMAEYVMGVSGVPKVLDLVDVDSAKWLEYSRYARFPKAGVYREEAARLAGYEARAGECFDRCVFVSHAEEALYRRLAPGARTAVVPNGVDPVYFDGRRSPGPRPTLVFTGAMDYFPNVDAVLYFHREILPAVRRACPEAALWVVGRNPAPAVRRLARAPGVTVTGTVPDVRPFLARAWVAVAPLRVARGVQNKILEAMAMGLPVVTTGKGYEGLAFEPGRDLFVHDRPDEFASRAAGLLLDPELRARVGESARKATVRLHDWDANARRFEALLEEAAGARAVEGAVGR